MVCALVVAAGCGGSGGEERRAATKPRPTTTPTDARPDRTVPRGALLGTVTAWDGNSGALLTVVDRRTLEPGTPWADLGEYHDNWSLSPDRRLAAFGVSAPSDEGRIGIRVIDLGTLQVVRDLSTGIVAEALGWLEPDRLAAFLQSGEVVVVDPRSGKEISRERLGSTSCPFTPANAVTPLGFVLVVAVSGSAQVVLADAQGRLRKLTLDDISVGFARDICEEAGMAVDPARLVAYVVGAGAPIAEVDLRTMRATPHRVDAALLRGSGCRYCSAQRSAVWLGGGRLAVTGFDVRSRASRARSSPAGVALVDTRTWTARMIARRAGAVRVAGDRLLVYDGRHPSGRRAPRRRPAGLRPLRRPRVRCPARRARRRRAGRRRARVRANAGRSARRRPAARTGDRAPARRAARCRSDRAPLNATLHTTPARSRYPRTDATFPSRWSCFRRVPLSWKLLLYITQPA